MKKTSLLLAVPAVLLSSLLISGCGMFRSHKAWDKAQQESPLEIPPGLSRPSTSDALVIPPPGSNQPTANGATAGAAGSQVSDGFVLTDSVDNVYRRVGQALENGGLGKVVSHDDTAHTYTLAATDVAQNSKKPGIFSRMFGRSKNDSVSAPAGTTRQVEISVGSSGANGSEVRAQGNAAAVGKVIDSLKARMGG